MATFHTFDSIYEEELTRLLEAWSPAARAASAAARKGRGKGLSARKALGSAAFSSAGGHRWSARHDSKSLDAKMNKPRGLKAGDASDIYGQHNRTKWKSPSKRLAAARRQKRDLNTGVTRRIPKKRY